MRRERCETRRAHRRDSVRSRWTSAPTSASTNTVWVAGQAHRSGMLQHVIEKLGGTLVSGGNYGMEWGSILHSVGCNRFMDLGQFWHECEDCNVRVYRRCKAIACLCVAWLLRCCEQPISVGRPCHTEPNPATLQRYQRPWERRPLRGKTSGRRLVSTVCRRQGGQTYNRWPIGLWNHRLRPLRKKKRRDSVRSAARELDRSGGSHPHQTVRDARAGGWHGRRRCGQSEAQQQGGAPKRQRERQEADEDVDELGASLLGGAYLASASAPSQQRVDRTQLWRDDHKLGTSDRKKKAMTLEGISNLQILMSKHQLSIALQAKIPKCVGVFTMDCEVDSCFQIESKKRTTALHLMLKDVSKAERRRLGMPLHAVVVEAMIEEGQRVCKEREVEDKPDSVKARPRAEARPGTSYLAVSAGQAVKAHPSLGISALWIARRGRKLHRQLRHDGRRQIRWRRHPHLKG